MDQLPPGIDLSKIPFMPNPSGAPPDFENGPSLQSAGLATGIAFIIFSGLFLVLRLFYGLKKARRLFADDWFCICGYLIGIAQWAVFYVTMTKGIDKHSWDVPVSILTVEIMQLQLTNQTLAAVTHFAVKASVVFFFLRLFGTLPWVRWTGYSLLILTFLSYTTYEIIMLIYCLPRPGEAWDEKVFARCATTAPATIAVGVCSVVADLVLFILPFPIIVGLSLDRQKKRGLIAVFLVGFLVLVTSVVGLAYRVIVSYGNEDPIWHGANVAITSYMEVFGTVIVACTPSIPGLWSGVVTQTTFYSNVRSRIRKDDGLTTPSTKNSGGGSLAIGTKHSYPPPTTNKDRDSHLHDDEYKNGSQRELVGIPVDRELDGDDFPMHAIQKTTSIKIISSPADEMMDGGGVYDGSDRGTSNSSGWQELGGGHHVKSSVNVGTKRW
ncbi:hypothetical protein QBC38DRAFT_404488 [Podospora fimiseda]|uniref:Rhodopsin domain-containing protein n=1 Tax=Podospora fimiseda TaxID=252190 RepID=A0AAN6YLJ0_9PEZI|nr:hypothetical protein QBC38DRAFT_404488 [Podospora fimiseda]